MDFLAPRPAAKGRDMLSFLRVGQDVATAPGPQVAGFGRFGASPFYCVQYTSLTPGATVLWGGDSHFAGDTTVGSIDAFTLQSCFDISTPGLPVSPANYAWGSSLSLIFMPILERMFDVCRPQILVLQGWTANDGSAEPVEQAYADRVVRLATVALESDAMPIIVTRFPRKTLTQNASELSTVGRLRQQQLALSASGLPVLDAAPILGDPNRPGSFRQGLSSDGIHPNENGHRVLAAALDPLLRGILAHAI